VVGLLYVAFLLGAVFDMDKLTRIQGLGFLYPKIQIKRRVFHNRIDSCRVGDFDRMRFRLLEYKHSRLTLKTFQNFDTLVK
jgi:hypothetical protein